MQEEWEDVNEWTVRLKVNGGHIYSTSKGICFVPDVDLQRYQAHLRDAYKQGYQAGQEDAKRGLNDA